MSVRPFPDRSVGCHPGRQQHPCPSGSRGFLDDRCAGNDNLVGSALRRRQPRSDLLAAGPAVAARTRLAAGPAVRARLAELAAPAVAPLASVTAGAAPLARLATEIAAAGAGVRRAAPPAGSAGARILARGLAGAGF